MTKHVWLVVDTHGNRVCGYEYSAKRHAVRRAKLLSNECSVIFTAVRATYEWPKGGKR